MQEALEPHVAAQQVPVGVGGQVEQQLLHQAAVLDLEGGHVRLGHNTGDLHQALHPSVHLEAAADTAYRQTHRRHCHTLLYFSYFVTYVFIYCVFIYFKKRLIFNHLNVL